MKTFQQFNESLKDYSNQGKNVRVPNEDTASFGKLFKDDLKQMGKFKNPTTGKLEGGLLPDLRKGYQVKQFVTGKGGKTAGVDGNIYITDAQKLNAVRKLKHFNGKTYKASPVKRV